MIDHPVTMTTMAIDDEAYVVCDRCGTLWSGPYVTPAAAVAVAELMNAWPDDRANPIRLRTEICCDPGSVLSPETRPINLPLGLRSVKLSADDDVDPFAPRVAPVGSGSTTDADKPIVLSRTPPEEGSVASDIGHGLIVGAVFPFWCLWVGLRWLGRHVHLLVHWQTWVVMVALVVAVALVAPSAEATISFLTVLLASLAALVLIILLVIVYVQTWHLLGKPKK